MQTRDRDIRIFLHKQLSEEFNDDPDTLIIDELGLCQGDARVDVAVINGSIHGYEIKSESDTLERLPHQMEIYNKVLDTITIITGECHINKIINRVPEWWGVAQAETKPNKPNEVETIEYIRKPKSNDNIDAHSIVQLLWRDEALAILKELDLQKGYLSKSRKEIWAKLVESITIDELRIHVRQKLKSRENWRAD